MDHFHTACRIWNFDAEKFSSSRHLFVDGRYFERVASFEIC